MDSKRAVLLGLMLGFINGICNGFYVQPNFIKFSSHPQSLIAIQNSTVTFQCVVNKTNLDDTLPNISIAWTHNGNSTSTCSKTVYHNLNSTIVSDCVIESVQRSDEGSYQCHVTDGINEALCLNLPCVKTVTASRSGYLKVINNTVQTSVHYLSSNLSSTIINCFMLESNDIAPYILSDFDVVWKKDGHFLTNGITEMFRIVNSQHNLLITTNSSTVQSAIGIYECLLQLRNISFVINTVNVSLSLNQPGLSSQVSVSLRQSSNYEYRENIIVSKHSLVELICLFNNLLNPNITWTRDNITMTGHNKTWLEMNGNWSSGNYCCSSSGLISCSYVYVLDSEPVFSSTIYPVNTTIIRIDCNSSLPVYWLHNGYPLTTHNKSLTLTGTLSELYGIYQCTRLNETIAIYRVLPFGWTNPVSYYQPVSEIPPFNVSLRIDPPSFTGALNNSPLLIKVQTTIKISPFDKLHHTEILNGPYYQSSIFVQSGDYTFDITVVNSLGHSISETVRSVFDLCALYTPVSPLVTLTCGNQISLIEWTKSSLDPYPMYTEKHLSVECFNNDQKIYTNQQSWSGSYSTGSMTINADITNGTCMYTMQGIRNFQKYCSGNIVTGECNMAVPSMAISSSIFSSPLPSDLSTIILQTLPVIESIQSTSIITTSYEFSTITPVLSVSSITSSAQTGTSISSAVIITSESANVSSSINMSSIPTMTTSVTTTPVSVINKELIAIIVSLSVVVFFLIVLFVLFFMPIIIWKQKRTRDNYNIYEGGIMIPYYSSSPNFLESVDTISVKTYCNELEFTSTPQNNAEVDNKTENSSICSTDNQEDSSSINFKGFLKTDASVCTIIDDHSSVTRRSSSSDTTQCSNEYLRTLPVDSSCSSTHIDSTTRTMPILVESVSLTILEGDNPDKEQSSPSLLKFFLPVDTSSDSSDPLPAYQSMMIETGGL